MTTCKKIISALAAVLIMITCFCVRTFSVSAEEVRYTAVLDDLQTDATFRAEDYPADAADSSLQVIQIAESVNGELFVYVYSPSGRAATSVNISTAINDLNPKNYALVRLDQNGVFGKYRAEGLTVRREAIRYYDIPSIFRAWEEADGIPEGENTVTETSYAVGKQYTAKTENGTVTYSCVDTETILITDKYCGYVRYSNGFKLTTIDKCDSWYVAFTTDRKIEKLIEADVYYVEERYMNGTVIGEPQSKYAYLTAKQTGKTDADGWFSKQYEWERIEKVTDFAANEDLTDETLAALRGKEWVLRFTETDWEENKGAPIRTYSKITDVTVLRLQFETEGKAYNLGVVDNKQEKNPDAPPDNNDTNGRDFFGWLKRIFTNAPWWVWLIVAAGAVVLLMLVKPLAQIVFFLLKGVAFVIAFPFRAIAAAINRRNGKK